MTAYVSEKEELQSSLTNAKQLNDYWFRKGFVANARVELGYNPDDDKAIYKVVADLINGIPEKEMVK